ncbi:MAG: sugar phosphate nucleotidyltransferase [Clostridium sp.]|nr:sugar phosphate nucleotidyltransferase [Prevotella sp.]MCM1429127.1 sugar phosphate nucleotidyltransferase [Clostridium sp.]MCM1475345.1 sugar phosphate nucleotidyltransferase [Muribaculaceae bacterium]
MNRDEIDSHIIADRATVREALTALNALSGGLMTLFVVDTSRRLVGSLTDGDIRRALTHSHSLDDTVGCVCHRNCLRISTREERYPVSVRARKMGISLVPIVDSCGRISDIADMSRMKALLPLDAVLMAGGRGERLRPLTLNTPKPMLPVGGRPIIDYNIESLAIYGVCSISVTVNYLREQLVEHFKPAVCYGGNSLQVRCVEEPSRLGTMGSLAYVEERTQPNLIVMNSDLLTDIDFSAMFRHHHESGADLTMGVFPYTINVPFAVVDHDHDSVKGLLEKPSYNYLANAGVYMMKSEVADRIPRGEYLDAPDLINSLISEGRKVAYFPIEGTWIDIGSPADYERANSLFQNR